MTDLENVEIEIFDGQKYTKYHAVSSQQVHCNIVERGFLEALQRPWTRSDGGIHYDFSDLASPPQGRCELNWAWKGCSATAWGTFIVVEHVKGTTYGILIGSSDRQKPVVPPSDDVYTFTTLQRSNGSALCLF